MRRTYVYIDGEFVEKKRDSAGRYHYLFPEFKPYKSMIDGRIIQSREEHRRHLRANNCIEVGNEDPTKHVKKESPKTTRTEILRHQLANMTHAQANKVLERLRDEVRFTHDPHRRR